MSLYLWENLSKTEHDEIDHQHQRALEAINTLRLLHKRGRRQAISLTLADFEAFLTQHFAYEEALMHETEYAYLEPHQIVNKLFLKKVSGFRQRYDSGEDMFEDMHASFTRWLGFHIHMMNRQD
ncbi:MAG: hemerythrin domain-containing protein [Brachymonas sp.]